MTVRQAVMRIDAHNVLLRAYEPSALEAQLWAWTLLMWDIALEEGWMLEGDRC